MTHDEILNMPAGREMDALVHQYVFGNEVDAGSIFWQDGYWVEDTFYSTDISAAWEVVEKLAKEPFSWHVESVNLEGGKIKWWACLWGDTPDGDITEYSAEAETAPLAICRVALLAVMK